jgi:teichuronic acid biosynthesis glycosyltransferase TuaC
VRVLTLSTLFPDTSRPRFGPFVEAQTLALAARDDVDVRVVAPIGIPPMPLGLHPRYGALRTLPHRETWQGVEVYRPRFTHIPAVGGRFDAGLMARALLPLLTTIRQDFAFDVIDASFFFPDGPAAVALGEALGVPVSIKARGSDIHVWGAQPAVSEQILNAAHKAQGLLAVSQALKRDMVAMGMPGDKIRVHYTGVALDRFTPIDRAQAKASLGVSGPLIVCVGNLLERKGQRLVVDALSEIGGATLALIGHGPDRASLEAKVSALGLSDRVRFVGSIAHDEMAVWLGAADVMVLASVSEGLANVWVEALACGTSIVITDVGGAREVVDRPEAGRLVAADPAVIALAVNRIIANPPPQALVRAAAERFTWSANSEALFDHLNGLVAHYPPR